jgi:hypothetical protein
MRGATAATASIAPGGALTIRTPLPFSRLRRVPNGVVTSSAIVPVMPAACRRAIMAFGRVRLLTGYQRSTHAPGVLLTARTSASGMLTQSDFWCHDGSISATTRSASAAAPASASPSAGSESPVVSRTARSSARCAPSRAAA